MGSIAIKDAALRVPDLGDVRAEFQAVTSGCGVYDLSERAKISVTGRDRVRWLNGMVSNNIRDLAEGHAVYCFVLNPQGHILGDLYAYNRGESFLIDTAQAQLANLLPLLRRYIIMDKVEITDVSATLTALGVGGPKALDVLKAAGLDVAALQPLQLAESTRYGVSVTMIRSDNPGTESYELWLAPENVRTVWDALVGAGAKSVGSAALELFRVAAGIPRYGRDIRERDLPQETEQQRALNFSKGCYIGQEIVERIRARGNVHRKFSGFEVQGSLPEPDTKIQAEGKDAGEVTSSAVLPTSSGDRAVALGYVRREFATSQIQAGGDRLTVVALPFAGVFGAADDAR